jgi:hypothetical protein
VTPTPTALELLVATVAMASWIAAVLVLAVNGLVLIKDRKRLRGTALVLLAVVLFAVGGTFLYQLGEVPS